MRSELVYQAQRHIPNRYLLTRVVTAATRRFHRPNTRLEETTNEVLVRVCQTNPIRSGASSSPGRSSSAETSRGANSPLVQLILQPLQCRD